MQLDTDVYIQNDELGELKFEIRAFSGFIAFGLKKGYRSAVDFHLDTRRYDFESREMVEDHSGLEWLRGQLQSCIHQLDDILDPDRGEPSDEPANMKEDEDES